MLPESTKDWDSAQIKSRNDTLIFFRFIAGIFVCLTALLLQIVQIGFLPKPIFLIGLIILCYNSIIFYLNKSLQNSDKSSVLTMIQVLSDWVALFFVAYFTGGVKSPSVFLFPLYAGLSGILLKKTWSVTLTLFAVVLLNLLAVFNLIYTDYGFENAVTLFGTSAFYSIVVIFAMILGLWASRELRERLDLATLLKEQFFKENERLEIIYNVALSVNSEIELFKVLKILSDNLAGLSPIGACVIRLLSDDRKTISVLEASGVSAEYAKSHTVSLADDKIDIECLKTKLPIFVPDVLKDSRFLYKKEAKVEGLVSMLVVPLVHREDVLGVIRCYTKKYHEFSSDDVEFVSLIATQASLSIVNAKTYEKVIEIDKSRTSFIRVVTHELRAPMAAVQSILQIVLDGYTGEISPKQRELFERANDRVSGLLKLVSELLEFEGTSSKTQEFEQLDARKIMTEVVNELGPKADVKHIRIRFLPTSENFSIQGWPEGLHRVFENLVDNAIKYTRHGGYVNINMHKEGNNMIINIIDNGIGIPEESLPRLFTEFYRAQNAKQEEVQGTGLGLAISKKIIGIHDGKFSVSSVLGQGTTFTLMLPYAPKSEVLPKK